jgi:hypothetical protein
MKLSEHIKACQSILDEHGDIECYYAIDEEGNAYHTVAFEPSVYYAMEDDLRQRTDCLYNSEEIAEYLDDKFVPLCVIN